MKNPVVETKVITTKTCIVVLLLVNAIFVLGLLVA